MRLSRPVPGLDGLRGLAALGVLFLHVWMYSAQRAHPAPALDRAVHELRVAVTLFFVLSAFLLVRPWLDGRPPSLRAFWVRRAARIVPAFWVSVLAAYAVSRGTPVDPGAGALPWFAVFAHDQVPGLVPLNPPLWSLGVEAAFYVVLPLLGLWLLRGRSPLTLAGLLAVAALAWCWLVATLQLDERAIRSLPTFLGAFGCGIGAAALARRRPPGPRLAVWLIAAGCATVAVSSWWHLRADSALEPVLRDLPAALGFAAVVAGVASRPAGILDRGPLRWAGTLSYGIYVYHWPVLYAVRRAHEMPSDPVAGMLLVGGVSIGVAALSYVVIERPAVRLARRLTRDQRRVSVADSGSIAVSGKSSSVPQRVQIAS